MQCLLAVLAFVLPKTINLLPLDRDLIEADLRSLEVGQGQEWEMELWGQGHSLIMQKQRHLVWS